MSVTNLPPQPSWPAGIFLDDKSTTYQITISGRSSWPKRPSFCEGGEERAYSSLCEACFASMRRIMWYTRCGNLSSSARAWSVLKLNTTAVSNSWIRASETRDARPVCFSRLLPVRRQGVSLTWLSHDETLSSREGRVSDEDAKPAGGFSSATVSQRLVPADRCCLCLPPGLHTI